MTDAEQRLAAWLRDATPEPPRVMTAERIVERGRWEELPPRPPAPRARAVLVAAAVAVAVLAAVLGYVAATRPDHRSGPATSPTVPAPSPTAPPTSTPVGLGEPPAEFAATRLIAANGRYAARLTDHLSVTSDAGGHWSTLALPPQLTATALRRLDPTRSQIDVSADGGIDLMVLTRRTVVDLYRHRPAASGWQHQHLVPSPPPGGAAAAGALWVFALHDDGRLITLVAGWGTSETHDFTDLFLSADGGATFTQRPTGIGWGVSSVLFRSPQVGLVVAGPADNLVYRTHDGGRTWQLVLGSELDTAVSFGAPTVTGGGLVVPRLIGKGSALEVSLERSADWGVTFHPVSRPLLARGSELSDVAPVAIHGKDVWVTLQERIYRSTDLGASWSTVTPYPAVREVQIIDATDAVGIASSDCSSDTDPCYLTDYLVATTDAGATWRTI